MAEHGTGAAATAAPVPSAIDDSAATTAAGTIRRATLDLAIACCIGSFLLPGRTRDIVLRTVSRGRAARVGMRDEPTFSFMLIRSFRGGVVGTAATVRGRRPSLKQFTKARNERRARAGPVGGRGVAPASSP